jgi:hypothetical protein
MERNPGRADKRGARLEHARTLQPLLYRLDRS